MESETYRIVLAEDHVIFREMIKTSLTEIPGLEVVGEVGDSFELLRAIPKLKPNMVILDIGLPHLSGLDAAERIKRSHPDVKILVLTMYKTRDHLVRALEARVDGYLLKENAFQDLITAMETIREGRLYLSSLVTQLMLDSFADKPTQTEGHKILSPRELEVLKLLGEGKADSEVAKLLHISEHTVRIHLSNVKDKLNMKKRTELMRYALKTGLSSL
jgi:DNA-binding NarL/FixJ family response regulator